MHVTTIEAPDAPKVRTGYPQAVLVSNASRHLFISGQIPADVNDHVPVTFAEQARQVWANIDAQLRAAGMTADNLVKVTIFLSDRQYALDNRQARLDYLGTRRPALTVIICGIFDASWLLEIEAIAAD